MVTSHGEGCLAGQVVSGADARQDHWEMAAALEEGARRLHRKGRPAAPKRIIVVPDGMADHAQERLAGKTPVEAAHTPHLDQIARRGTVGLVTTVPDGMVAGSDVANLSVLGYDPAEVYTGRAPLEAAGQGVSLAAADVAYRCNLVTTAGGFMRDATAHYIATDRARVVVELLNRGIGAPFEFYVGTSFRCLMVWRGGAEAVTTPPHGVVGRPLDRFLPRGEAGVTASSICGVRGWLPPAETDGPGRRRSASQGDTEI